MATLHVPSFGGGVVLAGSSDAQLTSELQACDNLDVGIRGQLQATPTAIDYIVLNDLQGTPQPQAPLYALGAVRYGSTTPFAVTVGLGRDAANARRFFFSQVAVDAGLSIGVNLIQTVAIAGFTPPSDSFPPFTIFRSPHVTYAPFPYVNAAGVQTQAFFVNVGSRYVTGNAVDMPGLYVLVYDGSTYTFHPISDYDALGTGPSGEFPTGTNSVQLKFRGIAMYNNLLFGWGYDRADSTTGEGPNRLMFSNLANPFKWGNDNIAAVGTNRVFADTDAITVGGAGESITAALASRGKLWIGTNRGLHYLQGYGRDAISTDGLTGVAQSLDVTGPYGLVEGPDGGLYGLSSRGLWRLGGGGVEHIYRALVAYDGTSPGYWDLLSAGSAVPGTSVLDLAWLMADPIRQQVWTVIPGCNATTGSGLGSDTVIIKYHTETGGFTRQVLTGVVWYRGTPILRGSAKTDHFLIPKSVGGKVVDYGTGAPPASAVTFGEYAPFGPDGSGVVRVCYLVLSWTTAALPITGTVTPYADQRVGTAVALAIQPTAPVTPNDGDVWVDTSGTDTNLGNATAGTLVPATNDYLVKHWNAGWNKWTIQPRSSGGVGTRIGIPIPFRAFRAERIKLRVTLSAGASYQIEGLGLAPSTVRAAA